jgi:NAD(P)-dependent dehydrogenase (short-subunit alcohol dehydrogenase family)
MSRAGIEGSVAVVTGASGNLGPVWIKALAGAGATVVGIDLEETQVDGAVAVEQGDIRDVEAITALSQRIAEQRGEPRILVNNAGIDQPPGPGAGGDVQDIPIDQFRKVLDVNIAGTFNVTRAIGSRMARSGRGSIVNIGSLYAGIAPVPSFYDHLVPAFLKPPAYGASKAAVVNLTKYFARLWGSSGVRVNALSPGGVAGGQDPEFVRKFSARVPLGRLASPEELAEPLLFLASEQSRYITGHELLVDGGFTA